MAYDIHTLQARAQQIAEATTTGSITAEKLGTLIADTQEYIALMEQNLDGMGIRTTYLTTDVMNADTNPIGWNGKALRLGQLALIYNPDAPEAADSGDLYAYRTAGTWQKMGNVSTTNAQHARLGGIINLTSIDAVKKAQANLPATQTVALYIVGDSQGKVPSTETRVTVPATVVRQLTIGSPSSITDGVLKLAVNADKFSPIGVNVGDIIALTRVSIPVADLATSLGVTISLSGNIELYQYKLWCTNDAKPTDGTFPGAPGIVTPWDKQQINAVPQKLSLPTHTEWDSNMNTCFNSGIYPWCLTGRPPGSATGTHYTLVVQKSTTPDNSGYYTIIQTCYGREGTDLGKIYQRIFFRKDDGTTDWGDGWKRLDETTVKFSGDTAFTDFNTYIDNLVRDSENTTDYTTVLGPRTCNIEGCEVKVETSVLSIARGDYTQLVSGPVILNLETGKLARSSKWNMYRRTANNGTWAYWEDLHTPLTQMQGADETTAVANFNTYIDSLVRDSENTADSATIVGRREVYVLGYIIEVVTRTTGTHLGRYVQKAEGPVTLAADGTLKLSRQYHIYTRAAADGTWQAWEPLSM